jgi:hypothetical protein
MLVANPKSGDKPRSLLVWVMSNGHKKGYSASTVFIKKDNTYSIGY